MKKVSVVARTRIPTTHLGPVVCVREEALLASKCTLRRPSVSHYLYQSGSSNDKTYPRDGPRDCYFQFVVGVPLQPSRTVLATLAI